MVVVGYVQRKMEDLRENENRGQCGIVDRNDKDKWHIRVMEIKDFASLKTNSKYEQMDIYSQK